MKPLRSAGLLAAIGTLLLSAMYAVNNVIPILTNLDVVAPVEAASVLLSTIIPALLWSVFFLMLWRGRDIRRIALVTAILAVATPLLLQLMRELPTMSLLSADSISFAVTDLFYGAAWIWVLLLWARGGAGVQAKWPLMAVLALTVIRGLFEAAPAASSIADAVGGQLAAFWDVDPAQAIWRLLAIPAIRMFYWFSQVLFLLVARGPRRG